MGRSGHKRSLKGDQRQFERKQARRSKEHADGSTLDKRANDSLAALERGGHFEGDPVSRLGSAHAALVAARRHARESGDHGTTMKDNALSVYIYIYDCQPKVAPNSIPNGG